MGGPEAGPGRARARLGPCKEWGWGPASSLLPLPRGRQSRKPSGGSEGVGGLGEVLGVGAREGRRLS